MQRLKVEKKGSDDEPGRLEPARGVTALLECGLSCELASNRNATVLASSSCCRSAFHGSVDIGDALPALGIGRVVASASKKFKVGAAVVGMLGAQVSPRDSTLQP